uniref:Uncharacterized protein n=1 Tax=Cucumis sativus TaxID=3659 RepID=A0A0A0KZ13_CUCSA
MEKQTLVWLPRNKAANPKEKYTKISGGSTGKQLYLEPISSFDDFPRNLEVLRLCSEIEVMEFGPGHEIRSRTNWTRIHQSWVLWDSMDDGQENGLSSISI